MADVVAGFPTLLTGALTSFSNITFLTTDLVSGLGYSNGSQWGLFSKGRAIISADTVLSFAYKQEWVIANYPLEQGAFETYDKVSTPYDVRIRFVKGGSDSARSKFLSSIASIAGDYKLYDAVVPEAVYTSCNVRHYDFHRTSQNGLGLLMVDVFLQQVRLIASGGSSIASAISGATSTVNGQVSTTAATGAQTSQATGTR
jgi:hypothetical protein